MVLFIKNRADLKKWFAKNHKKMNEQWFGFYKKSTQRQSLSITEALEVALCYGWTSVILKRIDLWTYQARFNKRSKGSVWSPKVEEVFLKLKKKGLVTAAGEAAYADRDKSKSKKTHTLTDFSKAQLSLFKKNQPAWDFFQKQAPGYKKYMTQWVTQAKREETQAKRLQELISDSADGTKLKRILAAQEKVKPKYVEGKTPIEEGKNIGLTTGEELRSVEISTVEQLKRLGWEKAIIKVCRQYPHRVNLNFFCAVIGAVEEQSARSLDPDLKAQAKDLLLELKK